MPAMSGTAISGMISGMANSGIRAPARQLPSPEEVSETLREILAAPEFATFEAQPPLWAVLLEEFFLRLRRLWNWLVNLFGEDGGILPELLAAAVTAAVLVAIIALARRHAPELRGSEGAEDDPEILPRTAAEWILSAQRRAGRGELRPAATALYQGFLLSLEAEGTLAFHGSKTPGDYALEIRRSAGAGAGAGGRFLREFEDFSFGQDEPTSDRFAGLARMARAAGCEVAAAAEDDAGAER